MYVPVDLVIPLKGMYTTVIISNLVKGVCMRIFIKVVTETWTSSSVGWSVVLILQGCKFSPNSSVYKN